MRNKSTAYRTDIDGLRAIAVLAVIINHTKNSFLPYGYLGVDVFFVISGFVITQSLQRREYHSFREYISGFYNRRVKRLVPALAFCVFITCILTLLVVSHHGSLSTTSIRTGITSLFGLSNLYLLKLSANYFGPLAALNPFTHTWSLGVEEQFYFIFPILLWIAGLTRGTSKGYKNTVIALLALGCISFLCFIWIRKINPIWAFYMMPTRFWELSVGAIIYLSTLRFRKLSDISPRLASSMHTASLLLLLISFIIPEIYLQQGPATLIVVLLSAFLINTSSQKSIAYKLLTVKPVVFIGLISYSLYLWHWSILTISRLTVGITLFSIPFQIGLIFILATLSYYFIEQPLRRIDWTLFKNRNLTIGALPVSLFVTMSMALVFLLILVPLHREGKIYRGIPAPMIKKGTSTLQDNSSYNEYEWIANECILSSNDDVGKKISHEDCTFGNFTEAGRRFLVIGNSFSASEIEMFKIIPEKNIGAVTITSSWGASVVPDLQNDGAWGEANDYYWDTVIPDFLKEMQTGDVLIMVNDGALFSTQTPNENHEKVLSTLKNSLHRWSKKMAERGIIIIYQSGNPFMRESNCTPDSAMPQWWNLSGNQPCHYYSRKESLNRRETYHNLLLDIQSKYQNFFVLDLFDIFCPSEICTFYRDGSLFLYRDEHSHPSVEASILAKPNLLSAINKAIASQEGTANGY